MWSVAVVRSRYREVDPTVVSLGITPELDDDAAEELRASSAPTAAALVEDMVLIEDPVTTDGGQ
jgi:hypothetical protein